LAGAGRISEVYHARDEQLGRDVAIKALHKFARDVERLRHFQQEARTARMLKYPSIITIYDMGARDGSPCLVAEKFEAGALPLRRYVEYVWRLWVDSAVRRSAAVSRNTPSCATVDAG